MIVYENIYKLNKAQSRLKRGYRWTAGSDTADTDCLLVFTVKEQARQESQANLDAVLSTARQTGMSLAVIKETKIQIAGTDPHPERARNLLFSRQWIQDFDRWVDSTSKWGTDSTVENSGQGSVVAFQHYRHCFALPEHAGVYDVASGRRLTNREEIIERIWALGFATWRGRPPSIAQIRWSGNRQELEEVTMLADRHYNRKSTSDMAKKMVSAFRSINRYAAWPGAW